MMRLLVLVVLAMLPPPTAALAAPKAELWSRWQAHAAGASETVDHSAWDRFLRTYVLAGADGINRVAYVRVTAVDRQTLSDYIQDLSRVRIGDYDRPEQRAFWINLYNALTVDLVLDRYPVSSIRDIDISPGLFAIGPWGKQLVTVEGEALSLDDIEHRILRPIWRDPRLHYVLSCAALGCPHLLPTAFTADNSEALLEAAAHAYVNHPRGVRIDGRGLTVSSIYVWYQDDFGGSEAGVVAHLLRYAAPDLAAELAGRHRIDRHFYDWALNDAR
jgi:hypothetical protein